MLVFGSLGKFKCTTWWTSSPTLTALLKNVVIDDEVNARIAKASDAFGRLHKNV